MESISSNFIAFCDTEKIYSLQLLLIELFQKDIASISLALAEMDWRLRRPSSVVDVALRARRDAFIATKASPARRASIASFMATAPGFKAAVVERVVMLKLKENAGPHEVAAMLDALHALRKLDGVQELTVGTALSVHHMLTASSPKLSHRTTMRNYYWQSERINIDNTILILLAFKPPIRVWSQVQDVAILLVSTLQLRQASET